MAAYHLHGLCLSSVTELPGIPGGGEATPDVEIRHGAVPETLAEAIGHVASYQAAPGQYLLDLSRLAGVRTLVCSGSAILIERQPAARDDIFGFFLLRPCMAALIYQRGGLPLAGAAIATSKGAVVFAGAPGSGASTVAAAMVARGHPVLADSVVSVWEGDGAAPVAAPGIPWIALWPDAVAHVGLDADGLRRVRPGLEKRAVDFGPTGPVAAPLHTVYVLDTTHGSEPRLVHAPGIEALPCVRKALYRPRLAVEMGRQSALFRWLTGLVRHVRIVRVDRPHSLAPLSRLIDRIEADLAL